MQAAVTHHYLCVLLLFIVCLAGDVWVWLHDGQQRTSAVTPTHQLRLHQGEYTHHHVQSCPISMSYLETRGYLLILVVFL